jgi:phosphoribosylformylglycinamidine synthase subunit PurQ / glutaminase
VQPARRLPLEPLGQLNRSQSLYALPTMKVGIVVFPGSNCDHDAWYAVSENLHHQAEFIWHDSESLGGIDAVILPGGFAYGDYLRCGAIAKFSPVMKAVKDFALEGGLVLGICNGFQVLTESGLLPGALVRNTNLRFVCRTITLQVVSTNSPFTQKAIAGQPLKLPVAHGEGCYVADESTLDQLEAEDRVVLRYLDNPNGSMRNIAGIVNAERNVMGMMPHPERAADALVCGTDGIVILESMLAACAAERPVLALSR